MRSESSFRSCCSFVLFTGLEGNLAAIGISSREKYQHIRMDRYVHCKNSMSEGVKLEQLKFTRRNRRLGKDDQDAGTLARGQTGERALVKNVKG